MKVLKRSVVATAVLLVISNQASFAHQTLDAVVVTANPLGSDINDLVAPVSVLRGDELAKKQSSTLGETLNHLPGISSTNFGPNSSRPVVRGLDGDRVRIMNNGGASLDVSSLSADHAVAIDPLLVEQIEVVRGPAALQYGGSAIGGAVNIIDNRIPRSPINGVDGRAEFRAGGPEMERAGAALLNTGNGQLAIHADAAYRKTDNLRIPGNVLRSDAIKEGSKLLNSNSDQQSGSVGASATSEHGYAGLSLDTYRNDYGTSLFENGSPTRIKMQQDRVTFAAEQRSLDGKLGLISSLHGSISHTDYKHDELVGSAIEATFKNKGWEGHFGGTLVPVNTAFGQLKGAWGIQASSSQLRMTGDAPLVPNADTNTRALYIFEELSFSKDSAVNLGARVEDVRIKGIAGNGSDGDASVGEKKFKPFSTSLGYRQGLNSLWTATSNFSYTERAPTYYELFSNGLHHATGMHEIGDPNQKMEKGITLDLALTYKTAESKTRLGAFVTEFSNFIGLMPQLVSDEYRFEGIKARLYGLEADGRFPLLKGVFAKAGQIDLSWKADYVRGENRTTGGSLPRIAPLRLDASLIYTEGRYSSQLDVRYAASQNRYDDSLGATPSYTMVGVGASYKTVIQGFKSAYWFVRVDNLTNEVARNASSVMRDVAMVGSRSLRAGLRASF
ncbi:TonB-dependent receptor [Polynucleobacter victoriensis]|uniref:Iron complex outermembrane recepter protein n=1 Tax=Polynucleobacter victoriensis TaxID=2049319 RepID=A0A212TCR9_9BURK|nr:TonB-dependent receptor [Polynucleobacter victoriensis]SNC63819.1 iron complex outermembrane recepter protein [Polynucleobacter victoriensis]